MNSRQRAFITGLISAINGGIEATVPTNFSVLGFTGQDGSYMADLLLDKGYEVHGLIRPNSRRELSPSIDFYTGYNAPSSVHLHYGDVLDSISLIRTLAAIRPHEIYHFAAQSHVGTSYNMPIYSSDVDALGTLRILEAILVLGLHNTTRFYNACSSEVFGDTKEDPQNEKTPFQPLSPYAAAKVFSYWMTVNMRKAHGMFAVNGILFNHESPRRGVDFVTRKITRSIAFMECGKLPHIELGNLDAQRDWGHSKDYVRGIHLMLQHHTPRDFVLASGEARSVRDFVIEAFRVVGKDLCWSGSGAKEIGRDSLDGKVLVRVDPRLYRPLDVNFLRGSALDAENILGWRREIDFKSLVREMVEEDMRDIKALMKQGDHHILLPKPNL